MIYFWGFQSLEFKGGKKSFIKLLEIKRDEIKKLGFKFGL